MVKKYIALLLVLCLAGCGTALALPDSGLFDTGKKAMALLSYGEYGRALAALGMEDVSEADFAAGIEAEFRALFRGTVQTEIAVMFREDRDWYLAVPVTEPSDSGVETMVFTLGDGSGFTGVYRSSWGEISDRVDACDECSWNREYSPSAPVLMPDI